MEEKKTDNINFLDELDNSPEHQRIRNLDELKNALYIFQGNSRDLNSLIAFGTNLENAKMFATGNHHILAPYAHELERFLHNYIASTYTIFQITNAVISDYKTQDAKFYGEYNDEREKIYATPTYCVMMQMRNSIQHAKLISISFRRQWIKNQSDTIYLELGTAPLLKFLKSQHGRKKVKDPEKAIFADAIKYLEGIGEELDLKIFSEEYETLINQFYEWVYSRLGEIHKDDLETVSEIKRKGRSQYVPTILIGSIMIYEQGGMGSPDVIFQGTMNGEVLAQIREQYPDMKERIDAIIEYLDNDIGLEDAIKDKIRSLVR